jgi:hypothetical protein
MGVPLPSGDPYDIPGVPRSVAKIWTTITLGNDDFHRKWPDRAKRRYTKDSEIGPVDLARSYPFKKMQKAILAHLPLLKDWPKSPVRWGELQFLESQAVVGAVHRLAMEWKIPALPLHDAVIVPVSKAETAKQVLSDSFLRHVGVRPFITIKGGELIII